MRWNDLSWLKANRPLLISQIIGVPVVVAWLLIAYFNGHSPIPLVLIALIPFAAAANLIVVNRARARLADPTTRHDSPTGQQLAPVPGAPLRYTQRWTGAADVPSQMGRMNASTPLAVLELTGSVLFLRVRPGVLSAMFGAKPLALTPADVESVFPARARLRYAAIAIRPLNQPPSYFLLGGDRSQILTAIASAGFPVRWDELRYSYT